MSLVCLDTHILIWGIKEEATPGQEEKVEIAKVFLKHLDKKKIKAIVPSVVVAEFLMRAEDENERSKIINSFNKKFWIAPFDLRAAGSFSKIWQINHKNKTEQDIRDRVKFDLQIVAIAAVNNADCLYTYDEGLSKFAKGFVAIKQMPDLRDKQQRMF